MCELGHFDQLGMRGLLERKSTRIALPSRAKNKDRVPL